MGNFLGYKCSICGAEYEKDEVTYTCPKDRGNLDVVMDFEGLGKPETVISEEPSIWRYLPLLPVSDPGCFHTPFRRVGSTPVCKLPEIPETGFDNVWLKDESVNPTASFKDRASAVVLARAKEIGSPVVVTASTGNAGAALAGMAAAAGERAVIFAPKSAPPAKLAQAKIFGARVILVDGNYDSAGALALEASREFGWYCRNTAYNPFTLEGKKTAAFEIWSALLEGRLSHSADKPLTVFVSVGDGNIISGIHKGFKDLVRLDWLETVPRIIGVQAEGSAAIARTWEKGTEKITPVVSETLADSISVDMPADGVRGIRAAAETGGMYIQVTDRQILNAVAELGRIGFFTEPAGAAAYAGFKEGILSGRFSPEGQVLILNTGSGLKDPSTVEKIGLDDIIVEPDLQALKSVLAM